MEILRQRKFPLAALVVLALVAVPAFAGNGKIAGKVLDASGQPLVGASVSTTVAGGLKAGTTTDEEGQYFILNVPPGSYSVEASYIGHQSIEKTDAKVRLDLTTTVDFELATQAVIGELITVTAERALVEPSLTTSRATIGAAEINNTMPVSDLQELINTTPSVFRGYIRGGRKAEAKVLIDGIDVSDTYFRAGEGAQTWNPYVDVNRTTGNEFAAVGINVSTVQELDIISGTFNAEYDAASAGVINVVTKEGGDAISGRLFIRKGLGGTKNAGPDVYGSIAEAKTDTEPAKSYYDLYKDARNNLLASEDAADKAKANDYYVFNPDNVTYGDHGATEVELSLGGPLPLPRTNFFLTTRSLNDEGRLPNEINKSARHSLKLTHQATDDIKLTGSVMIDNGGGLGDSWVNRNFSGKYAYYPQGAIGNRKLGTMAYAGYSHVLSPRTFYELKISQVTRGSEFGYSDDDGDGIVEKGEDGDFIFIESLQESVKYLGVDGSGADADGNFTFFNTNPGNSVNFDLFGTNQYRLAQPGFYYEDLQRDVRQLKGDLTSQINYNHQLKTGFLYRAHNISKLMQRTQITVTYSNLPFEILDYERSPKEMAWYLQDRIEYGGVIANVGVRIDGLNVDAEQISDPFHPSQEAEYTYSSGETQTYRSPIRSGKAVATKWFVQPRLGISHPISETAAMHYSWGKFYSPPSFSNLYDDYSSFTNPAWPTLYDVEADPTTATAYEMGLQYSFHPEYVLHLTAYYRDIESYSRLGLVMSPADAGFATYTFNTSGGYADSRGLEVSVERRPGSGISGRANYAYSYIKASRNGNNATPFPNKTSFTVKSEADSAAFYVALDNKESFNTYEANVNGGGNPLVSGYDRAHRLGLSLMAELPGEVMLSLITTAESGFHYNITATTEDPRARESDRAPWNIRSDLRFSRGIAVAGQKIGAFLEVRNLLDRENILTWDNHNIPSTTIWEEDQDPTGDLNRAFTKQSQAIYDSPRLVSLGLTVDF